MYSVHLIDSSGDVRPMVQLYSNNSHVCLVNAVLLKIPVLQSHCSSAVSVCRVSECTAVPAKLVKYSHLQADMTVHFQKSWRNLQNLLTENSVLVKKRPCLGKTWTFVIPRYKCRFFSQLSAIQGRGYFVIFCVMQTWVIWDVLGNAVQSHPVA